jgi:hypothetical protein
MYEPGGMMSIRETAVISKPARAIRTRLRAG